MISNLEVKQLDNGISVIHIPTQSSQVSHTCAMMDIGARDEFDNEQGITHLWEHMSFKGTKKRKAFHILNRIDSLGGELNAFTTKEKLCFHSSVLDTHIEKSIEILNDITFHSIFPENELLKEKNVIIEEIGMYEDNPEELIYDELEEYLFAGHPLSNSILGSKKSVTTLNKHKLSSYIKRVFDNEKLVVVSSNSLSSTKYFSLVQKYFGENKKYSSGFERGNGQFKERNEINKSKTISQSYLIAGKRAYSIKEQKRFTLSLLSNYLGGPAMNAKLYLNLREKNGLVYQTESGYTPYFDSGIFHVYLSLDQKNIKKAETQIKNTFNRVKNKKLGIKQLHTIREQLKGQLAMSEESKLNTVMRTARTYLADNCTYELAEIFKIIDGINELDILDVANEILDYDSFTRLTYIPQE